jgi:hypothetical protein
MFSLALSINKTTDFIFSFAADTDVRSIIPNLLTVHEVRNVPFHFIFSINKISAENTNTQ